MPKLKCPQCPAIVTVSDKAEDIVVSCTSCGHQFRIRRKGAPAASSPAGNRAKPADLPVTLGWGDEGDSAPANQVSGNPGKKCAIALTRLELLEPMPPVCLCCGEPATGTRLMEFPRVQVGLRSQSLGGAISAFRQTLRAHDLGKHRLKAPCCDRHRNQWWNFWILLAVLGALGTVLGWLGLVKNLPLTNATHLTVTSLFILTWFVVFFVIDLTVGRILGQFEVHEKFLLLSYVSRGFRDAMDHLRRQRNSESEVPCTNAELESSQRWSGIKRRLAVYSIPTFFAVVFAIVQWGRFADGKLTDSAWLSAPANSVASNSTPTDKPAPDTPPVEQDRNDPPVFPDRRPKDRVPEPKEKPPEMKPPQEKPAPPPEPEPEPQGPPPKGWTVLFRADDPALWNTTSVGDAFAVPVRKAHPMIRYVRLKRMDTGEYLVLPITRDQLSRQPDRPPAFDPTWWIGSALDLYGARHLGIATPPRLGGPSTSISLMDEGFDSYSGSGFGHKRHNAGKQYHCWLGKEIPKTAFEIAVTADPLTEEERRFLAAPDDSAGPPPKGWLVLFRADDPTLWNTTGAGEKFAMPVWRAHKEIRFLRLKRMDTGEALIVAVTKADLTSTLQTLPAQSGAWNGGPSHDVVTRLTGPNVRLLGIAEGPVLPFPKATETPVVACLRNLTSCRGSGFAATVNKKLKADNQQLYTWKGQAIGKTAFEIAVTADELTDQEKALLVK